MKYVDFRVKCALTEKAGLLLESDVPDFWKVIFGKLCKLSFGFFFVRL